MIRIINGRRYDTETAIEIGTYNSPGSVSDMSWWGGTLYKTPRSGKYFLHGEGGPMSQFGEPSGNGWRTWGQRIIPMSGEEAQAWAEQHLDADTVDRYFTVEDA